MSTEESEPWPADDTAGGLRDVAATPAVPDTEESPVPAEQALSLRVPPVALSCADVRAAVRGFCAEQQFDDYVDTAELLTSELVTNAIRYARSPVTVAGRRAGETLVIDVTGDGANGPAMEPSLPSGDAESGRGLFVVEALAGAWGTRCDDGELTVWFRLP